MTQCNVALTIHDYNTRQNAISACNAALCVHGLLPTTSHPTLPKKHKRQVRSHMSSTHCVVHIKSILLVEDEKDLLTSARDKLYYYFPTQLQKMSCRSNQIK